MINSVYDDAQEAMGRTIDALKNEFKRIRTGRASIALFEGIKVRYYGTLTPLNQVASLSIPESRLIIIQPWDQSVIGEIEKEFKLPETFKSNSKQKPRHNFLDEVVIKNFHVFR